MAQWNLSVDMRGQGASLARSLRDNARHARNLGTAARNAQGDVRSLGQASQAASGHVRSLGREANSARRQISLLSSAASTADSRVTGLGDSSTAARANLVRLAARARDTAKDLREIAAAAALADAQLRATTNDLRIRAHLDDDTSAGIAAVRASINHLQTLSPVRLNVQFDGDAAQIAAVAAAMRDLHQDADRARTALGGMTPDAVAAAAALNAVQNAAQDASRALRTIRGRAAAAAAALDDLRDRALAAALGLRTLATAANTADGRLSSLSTNARTLRTDLDDLDGSVTRVAGHMGGLGGSLGTVGNSANSASGGTRNLLVAAAGLATALIPIAAATVPIAAGMAAAGAAVGAFGVAIGHQISDLNEASEAQQTYDDAVREHGKTSTEAAEAQKEYQKLIKEMPSATQEAAAAVTVLKDEYEDWSDALAADTMPVAIKSMGLMQAMLPKLSPLVRGTSKELDRFMNVLAGGAQSAGFDRFMNKFTEFAVSSLSRATTGMVKFTQSIDSGEVGGDLREFLAYARENAPLVGDTLRELATVALHLLVAFSDVGVGVLQIVHVFAQLASATLDAIPPSALTAFLQLAAVMKLVTLSAAALGAVTGGAAAGRLAAYFAVMRAAGVGTTLRATAASMSGVTKAALGLGVLAVAAIGISKLAENARGAPPDVDKLTTSLKNLARTGEFSGELKKTFGDIEGFVQKVEKLTSETKKLDEARSGGATGLGRVPLLDDVGDWLSDSIDDMARGGDSLNALEDDFKSFDQSMASMVASGYGKQAGQDFDLLEAALRKAGKSSEEIAALFPKYTDAVAAAAVEQELAAQGMGLFGQQAIDTRNKLDAQKASADGLRQSIQALNDVNRSALGGMIGFEASIDAAAKAARENAGALKGVGMELDLNSPKAQAAATALQDLAAKTDENTAAARASGQSWETVNGIYQRGRDELIQSAMTMGRTREQAEYLADSILSIPEGHETKIEMRREDAIAGLDAVIAKIKATPGAKSVTVSALTADAISLLNSLGYKTKTLPDGRVVVTANTGTALANIGAVQRARDGLSDRTITITTNYRTNRFTSVQPGSSVPVAKRDYADGGVADYYANGGIQRGGIRHFAGGAESHIAQIAPAGSWRVWGEPETGGESYVPLHPSKRPRSRMIVEETVRRLGGDPEAIQWNAQGSVTDWRYDPNSGSLYSASDAGQAGHRTRKVKVKGKTKDVAYFDLPTVEKRLKSTAAATRAWNRDLEKVSDRVGGDVADALAAMGKDGVALTKKMANGSTGYINQMAAALRGLAVTAKASLADYTRAMGKATATDATFASNLATLAGRGHGDLASQLAAQGDQAAMELAAAAVKDNRKAGSANAAAKKANSALTSEQVQQLVAIIAAVKTSKTGIHDVADTTGLGEDDIVSVASAATGQISKALGSRASKFLADLARAKRGMSYGDGGIRAGIYSTTGGAVTFAEPDTGGEAFIPLGANKRRVASHVLHDVARRFGIGLTDISAQRQIVVIKEGGDTNVTVTAVRTGASGAEIGFQVGRSVRRVQRGGVNARA